jgi:hypothetical protein
MSRPSRHKLPWQVRGGPGRDLDTLMELQLSKVGVGTHGHVR